jgi:hypothetical protein
MEKGRKIFKIDPNIFQKPKVETKILSEEERLKWNKCYEEIFLFLEQKNKKKSSDLMK